MTNKSVLKQPLWVDEVAMSGTKRTISSRLFAGIQLKSGKLAPDDGAAIV